QGKLVAYNTLENLCKQEKSNSILLKTKDVEKTASILKSIKDISFFQQDDVFKITSETDIRESLVSILNENHVPVLTLEYEKENLYDIFEKYYQVA
ncbi:MAG: type transport system ATP-binding protein, partial [Planctomycetota bacterium]|nr:type transport system ATP-binding protein [Planctomycetota bacterium]